MEFLRSHRVLFAVYAGIAFLAFFEWGDPALQPGVPDQPDVYLAPDTNIADVSAAVLPDRALTLYYQAHQAVLCSNAAPGTSPVCDRRGPAAPGEVRELFERAIATGNRSIELLLYNYALVLLQEGAPDAEVDAAIRAWHAAHGGRGRPNPREAWAAMQRDAQAARQRPPG